MCWHPLCKYADQLIIIPKSINIIDYFVSCILQDRLLFCAPNITIQQLIVHIFNLPQLTLLTSSLLPWQPSPSSTLSQKGLTSQHHDHPSQSLTCYIQAS